MTRLTELKSDYLVLTDGTDVSAELEIRRSVFLGVLRRVQSEADARDLFAELRRTHNDARHVCSAFLIGPDKSLRRSSDDGEPSGTAGMPMLAALDGFTDADGLQLSDVACAVVRWFGGTLLGASGLVRAYTDSVSAALSQASFRRREQQIIAQTSLPHGDAGRVQAELRTAGITVVGIEYGHRVSISFATKDPNVLALRLAAATGGKAQLEVLDTEWVDC